MHNCLAILTQLHLYFVLPAKLSKMRLDLQCVDSWLNKIDNPVSSSVCFWQGELIRLSQVTFHCNGSRVQIYILPCQPAQLPVPHAGIDCQRPEILHLLVTTRPHKPDKLICRQRVWFSLCPLETVNSAKRVFFCVAIISTELENLSHGHHVIVDRG